MALSDERIEDCLGSFRVVLFLKCTNQDNSSITGLDLTFKNRKFQSCCWKKGRFLSSFFEFGRGGGGRTPIKPIARLSIFPAAKKQDGARVTKKSWKIIEISFLTQGVNDY
jgi:hypothetical protein